MYGPILEMRWESTSGPSSGESFGSQPISEPSHVAVAIEWIGDQIEGLQRDQGIKGSRGDTRDFI